MKIPFEDLIANSREGKNSDWLLSEIMSSLTDEHLKSKNLSLPENRFWEIKLLIDGIECEPRILGKILSSLEDTINKQAKSLMREKWEELEGDLQLLQEQYLEKVEDLLDNFKSSL